MLPPTYKAWKDSFKTFTIEASREHEKANLKPEQCWWFPWIILRSFFQSKGYTLYNYDPQNPTRVPDFRGPPAADSFGLYGDRTILPVSRMQHVSSAAYYPTR